MKAKLLLLPLIALTACSGYRGCSAPHSPPPEAVTVSDPTPVPLIPSPTFFPAPSASPAPAATPDPLAARRGQLLARIAALSDRECDAIALQFQLIPHDEILDPILKPRKELVRYVTRVATSENLNDIERAIIDRKRQMGEGFGTVQNAPKDVRQ